MAFEKFSSPQSLQSCPGLFSVTDTAILSDFLDFFYALNESVGTVFLTSESDVFGGHLTLPKHEIVDCGAFCKVIFFCISPKNLLGGFFYSLNDKAHREPGLLAIRCSRLLPFKSFALDIDLHSRVLEPQRQLYDETNPYQFSICAQVPLQP
jgi:hypothetical protein